MKKRLPLLGIVVIIIDLLTKYLTESKLALGTSKTIISGFFDIYYVRNTGAAWSMLDGQRWFFIVLASAVCLFLIYYFVKETDPFLLTAFTLMFAGTFGNLFDRIAFGYVRDMLSFNIFGYAFPVFNVADVSLVLGVLVLGFKLIRDERGI